MSSSDKSSGKQKNKNRKDKSEDIHVRQRLARSCKKQTLNIPKMCTTKINESNTRLEENVKQSKAKRVASIDDTNMICKICNKTFSVQGTYLNNIRRHEDEKDKTQLMCPFCPRKFNWYSKFIRHRKSVHYCERNYSCNICDKRFESKNSVENHRRTHTGERPYVCDICGKAFYVKQILVNHIKSHTGDLPFKCKRYKCNICGKCLSSRGSFSRHKMVHSDERRYKCNCGKSYKYKQSLRVHECFRKCENLGKSSQVLCDICDNIFTDKATIGVPIPMLMMNAVSSVTCTTSHTTLNRI
ncbi:zinc finger protein 665-like [Nylanderia fulva]|uniref:zinc finger protein 665-like n=1 Tax=Nylanderia fulva TaxID=613905 RepID=UPI0010FADD89|nr:zinc finger protein 665-like [Nylanderia fulva]